MAKSTSRERSRLGSKRQLKSGRWQVRVQHGVRADGSPRVLTDIVDSECEADARIIELASELGMRPDLARGITLGDYWQYYSHTKGNRIVRATYRRYKGCMDRHVLPQLSGRDITTIGRRDVQEVLLSCPTHSEADQVRRSWSAVMGQAVADGVMRDNPLRGVRYELPGDVGASWDDEDVWENEDPFSVIEGGNDVWDATTVLRVMPMLEGLPVEPAWLAMVGGGLRLEEAMALRWRDVRRIEIAPSTMATQLAVHHALTESDGRKRSKTRRSVRIATVAEPMGERLWDMREDPSEPVCSASVGNIRHRWKNMWTPVTSKHAKRKGRIKGLMVDGIEPPIPYVPLGRMRATHSTLMQTAGVLDSVNAAAHGHSERVSYQHYQRPDDSGAALALGSMLTGNA